MVEKHYYEFGSFRLDATQRLLLRDGTVVPLTLKAFELLLSLVESDGQVLTREELMGKVWPDSFVEEANLSHHIHKLREALGEKAQGEKYIETLSRRGYRFVAPVTEMRDAGHELLFQEHSRARLLIEESEIAPAGPEAAPRMEQQKAILPPERLAAPPRKPLIFICATLGLLVIAGAYFFWAGHRITRAVVTTGPIRSLAVMPFRPLSAESRDESLELGMADALITKLSNVHTVVVRPTSAILKYENSEQDLLSAGREQGVDAVIEGKVQRLGDEVKLTVQLIRVSDGTSLWAGTFNDKFTSIFTMQDSISAQVAASLVPQLTGDEQKRLAKHYTDNIEAYQLYQKGRLYWYKFTPEGTEKSIDYFNQAIAIDPNYALAYAGLSFAYSVQGAIGARAPVEIFSQTESAARTAIRLDDGLAEAHVALGGKFLFFQHDWASAATEFERAIELNSNQSDAHQLLGYYWEVMKQYEKAEGEIKTAQTIAPLMGLLNMDVANLAYYQHHYDEAIALYAKAHKLDPDFIPVPFFLGQAYERKGMFDRAIEESRNLLAASPDNPSVLPILGYAYARAGKQAEAKAILDKLQSTRKRHYVSAFMIALLCVGLDQKAQAFDWLNKAVDERDPQVIWVGLDPEFEPLHADPRFTQLLQRLGIS